MSASIEPRRALLRRPSESFQEALVHGVPAPVDIARLLAQHDAIAAALAAWGLETTVLEPLAGAPDACFVEDRAVVLDGEFLKTRSAVPSRAVEADSVAAALSRHLVAVEMADGTLDGGDVLKVGRHLLVGSSARTDAAGVRALDAFARRHGYDLTVVDVAGLHLKCLCSAADPDTVVYAEGHGLEPYLPADVHRVGIPAEEAYAANVVGHNGRVLVAAGYPRAAARLAQAGYAVTAVDNSEFAKRDGSLTCLSVLYG